MGSGRMVTGRKWAAAPSEERGFAGVGFGVGTLVEVFSEGMDGDAASLAELGLGQAAAAEIVEEGVPAEVEMIA